MTNMELDEILASLTLAINGRALVSLCKLGSLPSDLQTMLNLAHTFKILSLIHSVRSNG